MKIRNIFIFLYIFCISFFVWGQDYEIPVPISESSSYNSLPKISNGNVVWQSKEIYFYDGNNIPKKIDDGIYNPQLSGNSIDNKRVAIYGYVFFYSEKAIFLYDDSNKTETPPFCKRISKSSQDTSIPYAGPPQTPEICGSQVVWGSWTQKDDNSDGFQEIWLWDESMLKVVSDMNDNKDCWVPKIHNGLITWVSKDSDYFAYDKTEIFLSNGNAPKEISTLGGYIYQWEPKIDNGIVIWNGEAQDTGNGVVLYYDQNKNEPGVIKKDGFYLYEPQVSNGQIVCNAQDIQTLKINVFFYDLNKADKQIEILDLNGKYKLKNGKIVLSSWDGQDYEVFVYDVNSKKKVQLTDNEYYDGNPDIDDNGNVVWSGYDGSSYRIFMAKPKKLIISNVGDGESIRLKWSKKVDGNKKFTYNVWRKPESDPNPAEGDANWKSYYGNSPINLSAIADNKDTDEVTWIDCPNKSANPPERGVVYDYIVEVIDTTTQTSTTYGTKKGVAEPFVMLVRGYGPDEWNYWEMMKSDFKKNRSFREESELLLNHLYPSPVTIWDTATSFQDPIHSSEIYTGGENLRIGQITGYAAGRCLLKELKLWIKQLKESTQRKDNDGNLIESPDYVPEQFYVYCHSLGGPTAREMEYLINVYRDEYKQGKQSENLPFVIKNVMFSPLNCGTSIANDARENCPELLLFGPEWLSSSKASWRASWFSQPSILAKFNKVTPASPCTRYYFLGGHNWYGGGFGWNDSDGTPLRCMVRFYLGYNTLLLREADEYPPFYEENNLNDYLVTVRTQRGQFTDKMWNRIKTELQSENKEEHEFKPNPAFEAKSLEDKQFKILDTYPLNHYYGLLHKDYVISDAWMQLDIPPRIEHLDSIPTINPPSLPFPPTTEFPILVYNEMGILKTNEGKKYEFTIYSNEDYFIALTWNIDNSVFSFSMTDPEGKAYNFRNGLPQDITYLADNTGILYRIKNPTQGVWQANIKAENTGIEGDIYLASFMTTSNLNIEPLFSGLEIPIGSSIPLNVAIKEKQLPVLNASVTATLTRQSDNAPIITTLYDDGIHDDGQAANGIYGTIFNNTQEVSSYIADITANTTDSSGKPAILKSKACFDIKLKNDITIREIPNIYPIGTTPPFSGIGVDVIVNFEFHNPYIIIADLFDLQGNQVAQGRGEILGEAGTDITTTIYFKGEDINASGLNGPYVVKNFFICKEENSDFAVNNILEATILELKASDFAFTDTDGDCLSDRAEVKLGTDKTLIDTDNDGLTDYQEVNMDGDPTNYTAGTDTDPLNPDTDGNGHFDGQDAFPLDPNEWQDRDGDGHGDNSDFYPDDPGQWKNPNHAPVAAITGNLIYQAPSVDGAQINLSAETSTDPDNGDNIETYTWTGSFGSASGINFTATLPLGASQITLTVNDGELSSEPMTVTVKVQDSTPPVLIVPEDKTIEATALQTPVDIGSATATDIFIPVTVTNNAPATFGLGTTAVTWTATDRNGLITTTDQNITVTDTTAPKIIITSPEARVYKDNETNPVLNFACSDMFGISEATAILNGKAIANGATIKLTDLGGNTENILVVTAKDLNGNIATFQVKFTVEKTTVIITPVEIIKIIDKAVHDRKMDRGTAFHLKAELYLYEYFLDRAEFFKKHHNPVLARVFKNLAEETLDRMIHFLKRHFCKIDQEVKNILILSLQKLKTKI